MTGAAVAAALLLAPACVRSTARAPGTTSAPEIRLNLDRPGSETVDIVGLSADDLAQLGRVSRTRDEWTALLRIEVADISNVPVLGSYTVTDGVLRFTPQFTFDPGQRYDVVLDPSVLPSAGSWDPASAGFPDESASSRDPITRTVHVPAPERRATTRIVEVYPTAGELPENQLRMYVSFSAPMGLGSGTPHIQLVDERGEAVLDPFLPLEVDLWNEDRTRYTLLFDPGRVKRGILPNEQMGRSLVAGRKYTLVVDAEWRDGLGQPLAAAFRKEFHVVPAHELAIDPAKWRMTVPREGTRDPLAVSFPGPLDYALLHRALLITTSAGVRVPGEIATKRAETLWLFTPQTPWSAGDYHLVATSILEDVAGNRIGRPFEVDALNRPRDGGAKAAALPFQVTGAGSAKGGAKGARPRA